MKNSKGKKILNKKTKRKKSEKEAKKINLLGISEKKISLVEKMNPENFEFCQNLSKSYVVDMYQDSFCVFKTIDDTKNN